MKMPIIKNFGTTSIIKAFILNALAVSLISTLTVETRKKLNNVDSKLYKFFSVIFQSEVEQHGKLSESKKTIVVSFISLLSAMLIYLIMFTIFGFGGGMLTSRKNIPLFREMI